MKLTLGDRRKLNIKLDSFNSPEVKSFQVESTPTFNSSIRIDSETDLDKQRSTTKHLNSKTFMMCLKCDRLGDEARILQTKLQESEKNLNHYKNELNNVKDLHKNSRVYALELKNSRLDQDLQQCYLDKKLFSEENERLKAQVRKLEKELDLYSHKQSTYSNSQNLKQGNFFSFRIEKISNFHIFGSKKKTLREKSVVYNKPDTDEFDDFRNTGDERFGNDFVGDFSSKKDLFDKMMYMQSNFRRLSNEFSNMLVMLESVVQLVFINAKITKKEGKPEIFEEKTDARKVISHLLTSLNNKLLNIKLIFQEIQQIKDPFKELNSSSISKNSEEASDELLASKYIYSRSERVYSEEANRLEFRENPKTLKIIQEKQSYFLKHKKKLENLKKKIRIFRELKVQIKNEINVHRKVFQEFFQMILNETKKIGLVSNETRSEMERQVFDITEEYGSVLNENKRLKIEQHRILAYNNRAEDALMEVKLKDEKINKLKNKVKRLEEKEKSLNNSLFNLSKERFSLEPLSTGTTLDLGTASKLKSRLQKYKEKNQSLKEKYNNLKDEYNKLYLDSHEILKNLQENKQIKHFSDPPVPETLSTVQSDNEAHLLESKSKEIFLLKLKLLVFQEKFKKILLRDSALIEEKLENQACSESLAAAKKLIKDLERNLKEDSEKLSVYLENNSELSGIIEELTAENQDLKDQIELLQIKHLQQSENLAKEIQFLQATVQEDVFKENLKNKLKQLRTDLESTKKKLHLYENSKVLNEPYDKVKDQLESEKLIENYKILTQENLKLKEFLNIVASA